MYGRAAMTAIGAAILPTLLACSSSPAAPSPAPSERSPFAPLATGYYALAVDIDESCAGAGFPTALRQRRYDVVIEDPGWHFLLVRVIGGGFSRSPVVGELWVRDESRGFRWPTRLRWNEGEGNEAYEELLADSRRLHITGSGEMAIAESSISGALVGTASIWGSASDIRCSASHRVTFTRADGSSTATQPS